MQASDDHEQQIKDQVLDALHQVIDPELGINIVELGLIYRVEVSAEHIAVVMTLTTPACPMGNHLVNEVKEVLQVTFGVDATVELVWEPPWIPDMMSEKARDVLGWK